MRNLVVSMGLAVLLAASFPAAAQEGLSARPLFDRYGGYTGLKCSGGSAARFYTEKIADRWFFCTPDGHAFWLSGVYNVTPSSNAAAKYGDSNREWSRIQSQRLRDWNFNASTEYSNAYLQPTFWNSPMSMSMPFIGMLHPSYYSTWNQYNRAPGPVKDLLNTISDDNRIDHGFFRGWKSPDIWDSNYKAWVDATLIQDQQSNRWFTASPERQSFMIGIVMDDTDWLVGFGAGGGDETRNFNTVANGQISTNEASRKQPHLGWVALVTAPRQNVSGMANVFASFANGTLQEKVQASPDPQTVTISAKAVPNAWYRLPGSGGGNAERLWVTAASTEPPYTITAVFTSDHAKNEALTHEGYPNGIVHADPVVHTKAELKNYLQSRYATIQDLNNAWGTDGFYTTFGSTEEPQVVSLGKGDGTTTVFTANLPALPIDKYSLAVKVAGTTVGGDYCYRFHSSQVEVAGGPNQQCRCDDTAAGIHGPMLLGAVVSPAVNACPSYVKYDTGEARLAFAVPPPNGAEIRIEYMKNGWEHGTGLMDESGAHKWIPANIFKLRGAKPEIKADLDGFLTLHAERYFSDMQSSLRKMDKDCDPSKPGSCLLYLGPTYLGTWCTPALPQIIQVASRYLDVYPAYTIPCGVPDDQQRLDFISQYFGDKPIIEWDSAVSLESPRLNAADTVRAKVSTQEQRGEQFDASVAAFLKAQPTGSTVYPIAGTRFWALRDSPGENVNWGLADEFDNPYDGICSKTGAFAEMINGSSFPCGSSRDGYGDFISSVRKANRRWVDLIAPPPDQTEKIPVVDQAPQGR